MFNVNADILDYMEQKRKANFDQQKNIYREPLIAIVCKCFVDLSMKFMGEHCCPQFILVGVNFWETTLEEMILFVD